MKRFLLLAALLWQFPIVFSQEQLDDEISIGLTYYDMQTTRTMQNRVYVFDDGTVGAVWNFGVDHPGFDDLGVGYNYFDGNSWQAYPSGSITSSWAINPSYTNYEENGEICVSEGLNALFINWRSEKGTGDWQEETFTGNNLKNPVIVTSGPGGNVVHLLYVVANPEFVPSPAQPDRGELWYSRSSDGMQTWEINMVVPGLGADHYLGFTPGAYSWAEPQEDELAFVVGDYLTDLILMKSEDGGDSWEKTIIWEHPYPMFEMFSFESDTFYCNGGSMSVVMEEEGFAHVAFALSRIVSTLEVSDTAWYDPDVGGIAYWREDMSTFPNTLNSLNPDSLGVCENLIAWPQDINGNGSINLINSPHYPSLGLCTMPNLTISDWGYIFLVFSSVTETYDNMQYNFNHLWARAGVIENCYWGGFIHLTDDLIHIFDECVFPSMAQYVDDQLYLTYQIDNQPGPSVGTIDPYTENTLKFMEIDLDEYKANEKEGLFVDFRINQDSIFEGDTVWFRNLSCGCPFPVSYSWQFESGTPSSSSESEPFIVYNSPGVFNVSLEASNGQSSNTISKPDYVTVFPISAVGEYPGLSTIDVFPNPSEGIINIRFEKETPACIRLISAVGQVVVESEYENITKVQLSELYLTDGVYILEVDTGKEIINKKIIIRRQD